MNPSSKVLLMATCLLASFYSALCIGNRDDYCNPNPCGNNTKCDVIRNIPTCSCLKGYVGSPLRGCHRECEANNDCDKQKFCDENHDCPSDRPACYNGVCKNPCDGVCGVGADCNLRNLVAVCSCPEDMTGDPFVSCRPLTDEDLCSPNPCGTNARCVPGHDKNGKRLAICSCFPGYTGSPLSHCVRGQCQSNAECSDNRACINFACINPCTGQCGSGAICEPRRNQAICRCPPGYDGDALVSCIKRN